MDEKRKGIFRIPSIPGYSEEGNKGQGEIGYQRIGNSENSVFSRRTSDGSTLYDKRLSDGRVAALQSVSKGKVNNKQVGGTTAVHSLVQRRADPKIKSKKKRSKRKTYS